MEPIGRDFQARQHALVDRAVVEPELELVEHVDRIAAFGDRPLLAFPEVLDTLQGNQRIDGRNRAQAAGGSGAARRLLPADAEDAAGCFARGCRRGGGRGSIRSVNAHRERPHPTPSSVPQYSMEPEPVWLIRGKESGKNYHPGRSCRPPGPRILQADSKS